MAIDKYLDKIEDILDDSIAMPLSKGMKLVDADKLKELLDAIRLELPQEIKDAKSVVSNRSGIIEEANAEADSIIKRAEERARQLISAEEISRRAKEETEKLMLETQRRAKEVEKAAMDFSENALKKSEDALLVVFNEVKTTRLALRGKVSGKKTEEQK